MYYIKNGLGPKWRWMAVLFALLGVLTVFGTGNATQVNTITSAINTALLNYHVIDASSVSVSSLIIGIIIAVLVALILLGGIKRIGRVAEMLVPFMALLYIILALGVDLPEHRPCTRSICLDHRRRVLSGIRDRRSRWQLLSSVCRRVSPGESSPMRPVSVQALSPTQPLIQITR